MGLRYTSVFASLAPVLAPVLALVIGPAVARADVQHVVGRGHTIEAIANRYHVTTKSIIEANHLKDVKHLRVGDVLTIPKVDAPSQSKAKAAPDAKSDGKPNKTAKIEKDAKGPHGRTPETQTYSAKPKTPGVVHIKRLATAEEQDIRVGDRRSRVSPTTLKAFEKLMRSPSGLSHPIEARLVSMLGVVSNHFGSRKIEVVSGFRPFTPTQYNPHSNHNHGKAVDFRVTGVPNEVVRDFCRTLKNVGCGYYPNSTFVHMDVRDSNAFWIDYSKPGEAPRYNAPNVEADEGTSDVHDEGHPATGMTPGDNPPPAVNEDSTPSGDAPPPLPEPSSSPPVSPSPSPSVPPSPSSSGNAPSSAAVPTAPTKVETPAAKH